MINKLIYAVISLILFGCSNIPKEIESIEKEKGLTIYSKLNQLTESTSIEFEINGLRYILPPGKVMHLKPKSGSNSFKKNAFIFYPNEYHKLNAPFEYKFNYKDGQVFRIGLSTVDATSVEIYESSGKLSNKFKLEYISTKHVINANPGNVIVSVSDKNFNGIIYDNSKFNKDARNIGINFSALPSENRRVDITVKWNDFDYEFTYTLYIDGGIETSQNVEPSKNSFKYLIHLASKLQGDARIEFICSNELNLEFKNYESCIKYEKTQLNIQLQAEKEKKYQSEIQAMTVTKDGAECEKKFKGIERRDAFLKCFHDAVAKSNTDKKFAEASSSKDGATCLKKSPTDSPTFWKCFDENVATSEKIKKDDIAQQCISIGFEYQSKDYGDCYLKLKIHTEQIAQWKKMQNAIESQSNLNVITNKPTADQADSVERNLDLARRGFESAYGSRAPALLQPPPPPVRIITPIGNSYNCSMMGATMRCR